jgi:hypothetical protein
LLAQHKNLQEITLSGQIRRKSLGNTCGFFFLQENPHEISKFLIVNAPTPHSLKYKVLKIELVIELVRALGH